MAAVAERTKDPAGKYASAVDEQIAQATSRIRVHDLAFGGLLLAAMVLVYATTMILLDRYLALPGWVRQLALGAFLLAVGGTAYWTVVRPLRRRINPLYAAAVVERTIEDAKNGVTGYVEAQEKGDVHPTVKAAMGARAAKELNQADVNRAVDHRSLIYTGAVAVVFLLALVVLFFVFRPTQFASLVGRTFAPFSSDAIATRTQLTLTKPDPADPTITAGQSVTIGVHVGGRVPDPDGPERVRVLLRHNPADPNYEELPMERVDRGRDWELRVPDYLVQNGFWYKVAAGDAVTPEHRVTVRSLPLFTDFEVGYEFPAYLRMKPATSKDTRIEAYRGTKVTLVGKTNREVRDGRLVLDPGGEVVGQPVPGRPDSIRFEFKVASDAAYRLHFTATTGERNVDPPPYAVRVIADQAPRVEVVKPEAEEHPVPANGQLEVDATITDDFGIDTATLRMRVAGDVARQLADRPYQGGKSFRREKDGTWPTALEYKDSVDFTQLKDSAGLKVDLVEGMVLEYWLEAADNCTEPKPNVGKSAVKRVRVTPPKVQPEEKNNLDKRRAERKNEENENAKKEGNRLDTEERKPNPPPNQPKDDNPEPKQDPKAGDNPPKKDGENPPKKDDTPQKKDGSGDPKKDEPGAKDGSPDRKDGGPGGKKNGPTEPKNDGTPPKQDGKDNPPTPKMGEPMGKDGDPTPKGMNDPAGKMGDPTGGMGGTGDAKKDTAPMPKEKGSDDIQKKAEAIENELKKDRESPGEGKPNPAASEEERTNPADPKPAPTGGTPDSPPKPDPKKDPMNPTGGSGGPSETKPEGGLTPPPDPSAPKPDPKPGDMTKPQPDGPAEPKPAGDPPLGRPETPKAGDKPAPKKDAKSDAVPPKDPMNPGGMPEPKEGDPKADPSGGGTAKPPTSKPQPKDGTPPPKGGNMEPTPADPTKPQDPAAGAATQKPMNEPNRGADNTPKPPDPKAGGTPQPKKPDDAGDAKPPMAPQPADVKPPPKDDPMGPKADGMAEPKPGPPESDPMKPAGGGAAELKPDAAKKDPKDPTGGAGKAEPKAVEKGMDHPPETRPSNGGTAPMPKPKDKVDPKDPMGGTGEPKIDPKDVGPENPADPKGANPPKGDQPKIDPKDLADAAKDLTNPDPAKAKAAQEKLDKMVGQEARKEIENVAKGLESTDPKERAAAEAKLKEWQKKAEEFAKKDGPKGPKDPADPKNSSAQGKELSPQEIQDLANKAGDLNSPDDARRQAAEKEFDDKIGRENRQKLQEARKDPKKAEELKKQMDEMAKKGGGRVGPDGNIVPKGGGGDVKLNPAMEDNPRNRARSAELQLEKFEEIKKNPELQKRAGFNSPEEYDRFLEGWRNRVAQLQKEADEADRAAKQPAPAPTPGSPTLNAGGGGKLDARPGAATGPGGGVGGPTVAPPGFGDAASRFQKGATKVTPKK